MFHSCSIFHSIASTSLKTLHYLKHCWHCASGTVYVVKTQHFGVSFYECARVARVLDVCLHGVPSSCQMGSGSTGCFGCPALAGKALQWAICAGSDLCFLQTCKWIEEWKWKQKRNIKCLIVSIRAFNLCNGNHLNQSPHIFTLSTEYLYGRASPGREFRFFVWGCLYIMCARGENKKLSFHTWD